MSITANQPKPATNKRFKFWIRNPELLHQKHKFFLNLYISKKNKVLEYTFQYVQALIE